jgi:peptide-methionine (S)-S-oxide reductase
MLQSFHMVMVLLPHIIRRMQAQENGHRPRCAVYSGKFTKAGGSREGSAMAKELATLGGGCFWCLEAVYNQLKGVESAVSGYAGGHVPNPSYELVCTGSTGHAEVVQISFDPVKVSYRELLEVFFTIHDPTTLNRQGGDVGTQYRSVIFTHSPQQEAAASAVMAEIEAAGLWENPLVTDVTGFEAFYPAEEYHQGYFARNPDQGYCRVVIAPKVAKFRKQYLEKLKV